MHLLTKKWLFLLWGLGLAGCNGTSFGLVSDQAESTQTIKLPPLASAGPDQQVVPAALVTLRGQGSYHPAGRSFKMRWMQVLRNGEKPVMLSSTASATPTFLAPLEPADLLFQLEVSDGQICTYDTVEIKVREGEHNQVGPLVLAGGDRVAAADSRPGTEDIQISASNGSFTQIKPTLCRKVPGQEDELEDEEYTIWAFSGSSNGLSSGPDFITLFNSELVDFYDDMPQITSIEAPQTVLPGQLITLQAQADKSLSSHYQVRWQQLAGAPVSHLDQQTTTAFAAPMEAQLLAFVATISDGLRESSPVYVDFFVAPSADNRAPLAIMSQRLSGHVGRRVELDGSSSIDYDGDSLSFDWQQLYGPTRQLAATDKNGLVSFTAPAIPQMLAFKMQVCDQQICASARTTVVDILPLEENTPPHAATANDITLSSIGLEELELSFIDDEQDGVSDIDCQLLGEVAAWQCADAQSDQWTVEYVDGQNQRSAVLDGASDGLSDTMWDSDSDVNSDGASDENLDGNSDLPPLPRPAERLVKKVIPLCQPDGWVAANGIYDFGVISCHVCDDLQACDDVLFQLHLTD